MMEDGPRTAPGQMTRGRTAAIHIESVTLPLAM